MTGSIIIHGHSLLKMDPKKPHQAKCSCGSWGAILALPTGVGRAKARRNWHDDHKREVWRRLHPEDFQDDRPAYADMETPNDL